MIKVGGVGVGRIWAEHKKAIEGHPDFELVATADVVPGKADYQVLSHMLSKQDIDLVTICTPNSTHFDIARKCILAGKHVVIEKPMVITDYEAEQLKELAIANNVKIFPVLQVRYNQSVQYLIKHLPDLGRLYLVDLNVLWSRPQRYYDGWQGQAEIAGTGMHEIGIHYFDIFRLVIQNFYNCRTYHSVKGHITNGIDDFFVGQFDLADGLGFIKFTTCLPSKNMESSLIVIGEHGSIKIGGLAMDQILYSSFPDYSPTVALDPKDYGGYAGSCPNHPKLYANIADVLLRNQAPDIPVEEAIKTIKLINYFYAKRRKTFSVR